MTGGESFLSWVFKIVNFGILVTLLVKFAGKPLKELFVNRSKAVREKVEEAERKMQEAQALKGEYEERLARLDDEIVEFKKTVTEKMEKERNKILREAEIQAARIKEQAALTYEQETREALTRIRAEIAKLTVDGAERQVKEKMSEEYHNRLVEDFIENLRSLN